ncbi:6-hydroxymethylpterin diphosphokinase MptE-like protein [Treponema primitia]|uniref:6-hydroxymethylpterin diphosphokinase MptE-like protein n=1 Tax=Treponema primitia TaxID=88058 RepID=UPI0002555663|nr:6-hydroxymethylpterin diphosphokinase MptE-like protein [Treponema primitia]
MIDETPREFASRRGFSVSYKGKTLLSTMDPIALADRTVEALGTGSAQGTLYFCPSPLFGYGLKLLLEKIRPDSAVLCVEIDEKLMALSMERIDESILKTPRFRLVQIGDPALLCTFVRETWGGRSFRRVEQLRLSGGWQLHPEIYDRLADALRRDIAVDWGNAMTLVKLGRRYARNALRNLVLLPRSPPMAALNFGAPPVLVLGAGPSLDGVLDGLSAVFGDLSQGARRPFRIICVDTALSPLFERGIRPDLVVALESQHWNLRDFIGLFPWEVPVAMDLSALPATGEILGGQPHLFFTPWTRLSLFDRLKTAGLLPETLPPLGSVGLSATAIACRLSTGPIILAGIDFSFTLDQSHTRSSPAHLERLRRQTRFFSLVDPAAAFRKGCFVTPSKTGDPIRSNQAMKTYRDLFQREFAGNNRIRDIAGSGLPLGLQTLSPEKAYALLAAGEVQNTGNGNRANTTGAIGITTEAVTAFVREELASLVQLRSILTGEITASPQHLETLLDKCGYLWAHFPDCAGAEGRRPGLSNLGFLKRVRAEIDPFVKLLQGL